MVTLLERLTKFRLLLAKDVATFVALPLAMWLSTFLWLDHSEPARRLFLAALFGIPLGLLHRLADKRIRRLPNALTSPEMRVHAAVTFVGYLFWIGGILCVATILRDRSVWALTCLIVPILGVFCYGAVRANLGLKPLMRSKPSNQAMERTADRSAIEP
jgi:hypothetical protein